MNFDLLVERIIKDNGAFSDVEQLEVEDKPKYTGFVIPFAMPEYEPKVEKGMVNQAVGMVSNKLASGTREGTYGKLGHGGVVVISNNGRGDLFEFGRYAGSKKGHGRTLHRSFRVRPVIKDDILVNAQEIMKTAKRLTKSPGPVHRMDFVSIPAPNVNAGVQYAMSTVSAPIEYDIADMSLGDPDANCSTFASKVARSAGVNVPYFCAPAPTANITMLRLYGVFGQA